MKETKTSSFHSFIGSTDAQYELAAIFANDLTLVINVTSNLNPMTIKDWFRNELWAFRDKGQGFPSVIDQLLDTFDDCVGSSTNDTILNNKVEECKQLLQYDADLLGNKVQTPLLGITSKPKQTLVEQWLQLKISDLREKYGMVPLAITKLISSFRVCAEKSAKHEVVHICKPFLPQPVHLFGKYARFLNNIIAFML